MISTEQKKILDDLFSSQRFAVLATVEESRPYCNLVAFVNDEGLQDLYFATDRTTRKFSNINKNSQVSLLIANSRNEQQDVNDADAVTVLGRAVEIPAGERDEIENRYLKKHDNLKDFIASEQCALMRIKVEGYIIVSNFQNVSIVSME